MNLHLKLESWKSEKRSAFVRTPTWSNAFFRRTDWKLRFHASSKNAHEDQPAVSRRQKLWHAAFAFRAVHVQYVVQHSVSHWNLVKRRAAHVSTQKYRESGRWPASTIPRPCTCDEWWQRDARENRLPSRWNPIWQSLRIFLLFIMFCMKRCRVQPLKLITFKDLSPRPQALSAESYRGISNG